jgi:hypothetical protein
MRAMKYPWGRIDQRRFFLSMVVGFKAHGGGKGLILEDKRMSGQGAILGVRGANPGRDVYHQIS